MRKCLRCETEMVEDLSVMVSNGGYGIDERKKGMFKSAIEKITTPDKSASPVQ